MIAPAGSGSAAETPLLVRVRRRKPERRRWRRWALGAGTLLLVVLGIEAWRYASAAFAVRDGREQVVEAQQLLQTDLSHLDAARVAAADRDLQQALLDFGSRSHVLSDGWLAQLGTHLPWLSDQLNGTTALRVAGTTGTRFALDVVQLAQQVVSTGTGAAPVSPLQRIVAVADQRQAAIGTAVSDLAAFRHALNAVPHTPLAGPLESARQTVLRDGAQLSGGAGPALAVLQALPSAIGPGTHTYLLLLENPGEERPSGGYIGAVGVVTFTDGRLAGLQFNDSAAYTPPEVAIPIPQPLDTYLFHSSPWELQDANWSPDFPTAMADVERFYTADTGKTVDGDISVDPIAMEYVLQLIGPVHVPSFTQTITSQNALQELNYITNYARPGDPGKAFLAPFGQVVTQDVLQAPTSQLPSLVSALQRAATQKHLVAFFHQQRLENLVTGAGFGGVVSPATSDSVMVDDANLSGTKGDLFVQRHFSLQVQVSPDGSVRDQLTLTYTNPVVTDPADKALLPNSGGAYRDYVRLLIPETVQMQTITTSVNGGAAQPMAPDAVTYQFEQQVVGLWFVLPQGSSERITLTYTGPLADVSVSPERYQLTWVKQVNALDWPVSASVRMPDGRVSHWSSQLATDQTWSASN
ncbi:MAG: DUF4012 domain-containing protein [Candidatus Dormibacteraeota bacterium]|nr:DUF4012 domain-containing protein [Candidatus Dormibacteraeota bacterium]